jgi:hypothetical protein
MRELYVSPNGDHWHLRTDEATGHVVVRHTANMASGGSLTDIPLSTFLGAGRNGPEHQALWNLLRLLAEAHTH